ncbi:MAG: autotransporter outer membrane beta-barrel domain-containing protein [Methylocystaceae bacterium]|nr:autotransporter outer membrane beta-barrel domain-containing protein [Methylocystaceae bacterium]
MTFGIFSGDSANGIAASTPKNNTSYKSVLQGVPSSSIINKTGIYDGLSWKLVESGANTWDLIFGYIYGVSVKNTTQSFSSNQQSINSILQQRYAVMAVVLNYDCANFDKYGVCISFQSRATGFGNQSTGAGVLTASHKITDKIHVGAFLDYQVNQVAPGVSSLGPGGVQSGYNNATFGGFAGYYANPDRTGLQAKISGAYNPGKVTVTRPLLENTEAGMGTAGLNGSGVYGEIGWGLSFARSVVATPFVGIRGIDITRNGYSESYNAAVQYPISYNSYFERVITGIAGGQIKSAITDRLSFQAGVWAELDVRRSANAYSGWSTIPGLETFSLAHGGATNKLRPAGYAGISYEVAKNQRITANTVVRQQAYSDRTNVTGLVGYQISF